MSFSESMVQHSLTSCCDMWVMEFLSTGMATSRPWGSAPALSSSQAAKLRVCCSNQCGNTRFLLARHPSRLRRSCLANGRAHESHKHEKNKLNYCELICELMWIWIEPLEFEPSLTPLPSWRFCLCNLRMFWYLLVPWIWLWEELWSLRESKTAGARHSLPERNPSIKAWLSMRPPLEVFTLPQIFSEFLNQNMWRKYVERDTNKHMQWMKTNITWLQVTRQCSIHHTHTFIRNK